MAKILNAGIRFGGARVYRQYGDGRVERADEYDLEAARDVKNVVVTRSVVARLGVVGEDGTFRVLHKDAWGDLTLDYEKVDPGETTRG